MPNYSEVTFGVEKYAKLLIYIYKLLSQIFKILTLMMKQRLQSMRPSNTAFHVTVPVCTSFIQPQVYHCGLQDSNKSRLPLIFQH
jgi:hypothetical protein